MYEYMDPDEAFELQCEEERENEYDDYIEPPQYVPNKTRKGINFDKNLKEVPPNVPPAAKRPSNELPGVEEPPPAKKPRHSIKLTALDEDLGVSFLESSEPDSQPSSRFTSSSNLNGVTSLRFPTWNFLTINTDFNERLYVRLRNPTPVSDSAEFEAKTSVVSNAFKLLKEKVLSNMMTVQDRQVVVEEPRQEVEVVTDSPQLWVEQFKPKHYFDLLSDTGVNWALLNWVKAWDKVVFNRTRNPKKIEIAEPQFKAKWQIQDEKSKELDEDGRPHYKVALLCGSPGVGKTTLAHVIASLAGYNVIEVNASDDRDIATFKTRLESATEMQAVFNNKRPNCLILDEIDGAPAPSIDFLVKYIEGKVTAKTKAGKKDKEKVYKVLKRPVVCICNEPYTPALRQLRQHAFVLSFPNTSAIRLAQRLLEICRHQGMMSDMSTLSLLCDKAESDIRSCITTLHFFKSQKRKSFRSSDVKNASVGLKDMQKSIFTIWQEIFHKPMKMSVPCEAAPVTASNSFHPDNIKRLKNIVTLLSSAGDYDKLLQGVYENVLKMQFPWFRKAMNQGLEWFCLTDLLDTSIRHGQNFSLMPYLPYAFAKWHFLYATAARPKIVYPTAFYENFIKESKSKQILDDVLRGLKPSLRIFYQSRTMLLDVLPLLPTILSPALRPVSNVTLFNEKEKADMQNLVNILLDFNMNYVQHRAADGNYFYVLDPTFEEVVKFQCSSRKVTELSYSLKQVIAREVGMERVRRSEAVNAVETKSTSVAGHLVKLKPKIVPEEPMQYKDFFGRVVKVTKSKTEDYGADKSNYLKSPVWFNYKAGFNNAVKKDMTIADLL